MLVPETKIIVSKGGEVLAQRVVTPGDYVLGRAADADIQFEADLVSRQHAKLIVNYNDVLVEDLGSSNGTTINGKPVTEVTKLWPGQKIQIGAATVELRRMKTQAPPGVSLAPGTAAVRQLLPEEIQ